MSEFIESEDEVLDPQSASGSGSGSDSGSGSGSGAGSDFGRRARLAALAGRLRERTPLGRREADPQRRQRAVRAGALALALVAAAGAAGAAVHRADVNRDRSRVQERILLHLLGGGASLTYAGAGARDGVSLPDSFEDALPTDFTIGVRNDGALPVEVVGVQIRQPGVDVLGSAPKATVNPGESVALSTRVAVHCTAAGLPQAPSGATLTVRVAAGGGKAAGSAEELAVRFTAGGSGSQDADSQGEVSQGAGPGAAGIQVPTYVIGSYVTNSFYRLCGNVLAMMPRGVTATSASSDASPGNPVVRYTLHVAGTPGAAEVVSTPGGVGSGTGTTAATSDVPGVTSESDLHGPQAIGPNGVDIAITDRITDCTAFGDYLSTRGGAATATLWLASAAQVSVQAADPRFRVTQAPLSVLDGFDLVGMGAGNDAEFQRELLNQIASACPDL